MGEKRIQRPSNTGGQTKFGRGPAATNGRTANKVHTALRKDRAVMQRTVGTLQNSRNDPAALQKVADGFGMSREELGKLGDQLGVSGCGPHGCGPKTSTCGPEGCGPKGGAGQEAGDAGGAAGAAQGGEAGAAGGEGQGLDLNQILDFIKQLIQGGGEQGQDPQQQLLDQVQQAGSIEELAQVVQQAGDPQQLPPEVQQAIAQKAQQLGVAA